MAEVKVGSWLIDNDPRNKGRKVQVTALYTDNASKVQYAVWKSARRINKIRLDRIITDPNVMTYNSGWSLAPETV